MYYIIYLPSAVAQQKLMSLLT